MQQKPTKQPRRPNQGLFFLGKETKLNNEVFEAAVKRSMPTILTVCAAVGLVASNILTAKATLKVDEIIKDENNEKPLTTKEKIKIAVPHYVPSIVVGCLSIACIV